jgi:hypothetical protein
MNEINLTKIEINLPFNIKTRDALPKIIDFPKEIQYKCFENKDHNKFSSDLRGTTPTSKSSFVVYDKFGEVVRFEDPNTYIEHYTCLECGEKYIKTITKGKSTFEKK